MSNKKIRQNQKKKELYKRLLLGEFLILELEDTLDKSDEYKKIFENDFKTELEQISKKKSHSEPQQPQPQSQPQSQPETPQPQPQKKSVDIDGIDGIDEVNKDNGGDKDTEGIEIDLNKYNESNEHAENNENKILMKVYKQLALKFHPDKNRGNEEYETIFKNINEYYTKKNILYLLILCRKYDVKIDFEDINETELLMIETNLKCIENDINKEKHTVYWQWNNSDDNGKINIKNTFIKQNLY